MAFEINQEALREAFNKSVNSETVEFKAEEPTKVEIPIVETEVTEPLKTEVAKAEEKEESVKVKTFEEELTERFEGKYKNADELKAALNTPKEEFADDEVKHWNELKKKGVKLDKEFFELQSKDFESMTDPFDVSIEAMKLKPENKNLSAKTLQVQLNKKYNLSEWIDKDEVDLTEEDVANKEIFMRDAQADKDWLINYKKERTFVPQEDPEKIKKQSEMKAANLKNWETFVDTELTAKVKKLSTVIDDKSGVNFDYEVSSGDAEEASKIMKTLPDRIDAIFDQFTSVDDKGVKQINHHKVFEMIVKNKNYDQAVKNAYRDGLAEGAKKEIKENVKNIDFTQKDSKSIPNGEPISREDAIRKAIRAKFAK